MKINWFKLLNNEIQIELFEKIAQIINYTLFSDVASFLILLKQGEICKDCGKFHYNCKCNFCEKCQDRICTCFLFFSKRETLTFIVYFINHNLSRNKIDKLKNRLFYVGYPNVRYVLSKINT